MVRIRGAYSIKNLQFPRSIDEIGNNPSVLKLWESLREFIKTHPLALCLNYDPIYFEYVCEYKVLDKTVEKARKTVDDFETLISKMFTVEFLGETQTEYVEEE